MLSKPVENDPLFIGKNKPKESEDKLKDMKMIKNHQKVLKLGYI